MAKSHGFIERQDKRIVNGAETLQESGTLQRRPVRVRLKHKVLYLLGSVIEKESDHKV